MDTLIYWISLLAKLLIFLFLLRLSVWGVFWLVRRLLKVDISLQGWRLRGFESLSIKTSKLELQVNRVYLSVRWFDSTCRHFFKINVDGVHLEYYNNGKTTPSSLSGRGNNGSDNAESAARNKTMDNTNASQIKGPSRKKRLMYWGLCKILKRVELCVRCLEMWLEHKLEDSATLIVAFQVQGRLAAIAKPLPNKELAVSLEVEKANGQLLLQTDTPCPTTDDGIFTLADLLFSTKVYLFLCPLQSTEPFQSLQVNTVPLSFSLQHEDAALYVTQYLTSLAKMSTKGEPQSESGTVIGEGSRQNSKLPLPKKIEVVLEDVKLQYQANVSNRVLSSKLTRISLAAKVDSTEPSTPTTLPGLSVTVGMQGMLVNDSLGHQIMKLQQLILTSESSSSSLSNRAQVDSLHASLWESETVFWLRHVQDVGKRFRTKLQSLFSRTKRATSSNNLLSQLFGLPVSMATTLEASDWSVQLRPDAVSLQSKEPLCRLVAAALVGNLQWEPCTENQHTTTVNASVRVEDAYVHVPGYHPALDNPAFYRQRTDNPRVLPSLHKHLWGRAASLGSLILKTEKEIIITRGTHPSLSSTSDGGQGVEVKFTNDPLKIVGDGSCLMFEWSQPTTVALVKAMDHLRSEYKLFGSSGEVADSGGEKREVSEKGKSSLLNELPLVDLKFRLTDINAFLYSLVPEPPAAMLRLDVLSISSSTTLPSLTFDLHGLLLDDVHLRSPEQDFYCSNIANLPQGVGVATVTSSLIKYNHSNKDVDVGVAKLSLSWSTTAHRCLYLTATHLLEDIYLIRGILRKSEGEQPAVEAEKSSSRDSIVAVGDVAAGILKRVPLSLAVNLESVEAIAHLERRAKVSVILSAVQCSMDEGVVKGGVNEVGIRFDSHQVFTMEEFAAVFPHHSQQLAQQRTQTKQKLDKQTNSVVWLKASTAKLIFPYKYKFSLTMDKLLNVKKFLQKLHSTSSQAAVRGGEVGGAVGAESQGRRLLLPPDLFLECQEIILQITDDPFEVKLKANYELMCDEYEQKTRRLEMLREKLKKIKEDQGEIAVSRKMVQSLYDSLELKDSEIYCKRAKEMYSSAEPLRTGLFVFSMKDTRLLAMFDPTMLGEENLINNLKDIDKISPLPEGRYKFSTLWGGYVSGSTQKLQIQLRDYPHPLLDITEIIVTGRMMFAEQEAQERETRSAVVEVGHPWSNVTIKRKLPPLKYYYDFEMRSHTWDISYGPCLEPVMAETSIGFGLLTSPTVDPSKPLPYWDKLRLLFHGTIHLVSDELRLILPSTFNPYNMVEYLELVINNLDLQLLTNTQLILEGAVQLFVHTASKYDSCEILNFPRARSTLNLNWFCGGKDPNRHHYVVRCAPDKIPVQPDKQEHDSYSGFRSLNLDVDWKLEVLPQLEGNSSQPDQLLLYSSTLRCLQQYQVLIGWNVTRPTRRGKYFNNVKPKRPPLLRHWRNVSIGVSFPQSVLHYWSSKAHQRGIKCTINQASFSVNYQLSLVPYDSGLTQRPKANWTICNCCGSVKNILAYVKTKIVVRTAEGEIVDLEIDQNQAGDDHTHEQSILLSMDELKYSRQEAKEKGKATSEEDNFTHQLETINTRLLWNPSNRNVVLGLYDAYKQAQRLKRDLSTEALKSILLKFDAPPEAAAESQESEDAIEDGDSLEGSPRSYPRQHSRPRHASSGNTMLDQLLSDISNKFVKYVDERASSDPLLKGIHAGSMNDVIHKNWLITLSNTQIALQGLEKTGYILVSSHIAQVFGREHEPQLNEGDLVTKKSWVAKVQELQYFSTVGSSAELEDSNCIPWLPLSVIQPPGLPTDPNSSSDTPKDEEEALNVLLLSALGPDQGKRSQDLGRSLPLGEAVGGLVSCVLLSSESEEQGEEDIARRTTIQLQRIATRCHCQIFYITYGEQPELEDGVRASPPPALLSSQGTAEGLSTSNSETVDTFTFRYPTVEICTTSSQYTMIIDILNNLLLHKEPKKKEAIDRHARMQFTLQLSSNIQDPRKPVQLQQTRVRACVRNVRNLETQLYLKQRSGDSSAAALVELEGQLSKAKEDLTTAGLRLRAMIRAFKENQLFVTPPSAGDTEQEAPEPVRRIEVWVDDAHWWLTHDDGQLQLADVCFTNFSYNRISFSDDSGEHRVELGTFKVSNLMPNTPSVYQEVLIPYDPKSKHLRVDKNISLRVYCKDKAPVAGISVKEHLEVNVVPLAVCLTAKFYQTMQDFFFPKAEEGGASADSGPDHSYLFGPSGAQPSPAYGEGTDGNSLLLARGSSTRRSTYTPSSLTASNSTVANPSTVSTVTDAKDSVEKGKHVATVDDVEKMKERATHIKTFIYVKIPQITVCITYKSENVSIKDLQNQRVLLPILEYHNRNWTWTDMLMEVKKDYKNAIISQTLKSAIGMKESDEIAGLASPKAVRRTGDFGELLLGRASPQKGSKGRKLFGKLGASKDDHDDSKRKDNHKSEGGVVAYQPPLRDPDVDLKRTMRKLTKLSQDAQK